MERLLVSQSYHNTTILLHCCMQYRMLSTWREQFTPAACIMPIGLYIQLSYTNMDSALKLYLLFDPLVTLATHKQMALTMKVVVSQLPSQLELMWLALMSLLSMMPLPSVLSCSLLIWKYQRQLQLWGSSGGHLTQQLCTSWMMMVSKLVDRCYVKIELRTLT